MKKVIIIFGKMHPIEDVREDQKTKDPERKEKFLKLGIIEKTGIGRGTKYILSKQFYGFIGGNGEYTRKR
jgi:hypothetical protein